MESTTKQEAQLQSEEGKANFAKKMADWQMATDKAKAENTPLPAKPDDWLAGNHRAGTSLQAWSIQRLAMASRV